jgi:hypothetical protein
MKPKKPMELVENPLESSAGNRAGEFQQSDRGIEIGSIHFGVALV